MTLHTASSTLSLRTFRILVVLVGFLDLATQSFTFCWTITTMLNRNRSRLQPMSKSVRVESSLKSSWSKIVDFDANSESFRLLETANVVDDSELTTSIPNESSPSSMEYDLTSPREWLEFCEANQTQNRKEGREVCGGAYTVLRCDFRLDQNDWRIWGRDFHWNRLRESYRLLVQHKENSMANKHEPNEEWEQSALDSSREAMAVLLAEAERSMVTNSNDKTGHPTEPNDGSSVVVVMLTLLWDPAPKDGVGIRVRGHGFSTMKPSLFVGGNCDDKGDGGATCNPNPPIKAVIGHLSPAAIERITNHYDNSRQDTAVLPNRYQNNPQAKLSSWCRRRRLLEHTFKKHSAGDVILTKHHESDDNRKGVQTEAFDGEQPSIELLEGLTSNLFVVYPGKVLRTAPSSRVLGGYARELILGCAGECGYRVEIGPVLLEDSSQWKEVFLTSSIRLIIPVHKLLLPNTESQNVHDDNEDDTELLRLESMWEMPPVEESEVDDCPPRLASDEFYQKLMEQEK